MNDNATIHYSAELLNEIKKLREGAGAVQTDAKGRVIPASEPERTTTIEAIRVPRMGFGGL